MTRQFSGRSAKCFCRVLTSAVQCTSLSERLRSLSITDDSLVSQTNSDPEAKALVCWLKSIPVDQDTINKVKVTEAHHSHPHTHTHKDTWYNIHLCVPVFQLLSHRFTLDCLLCLASRDDLMYSGIRWAVCTHHLCLPFDTRKEKWMLPSELMMQKKDKSVLLTEYTSKFPKLISNKSLYLSYSLIFSVNVLPQLPWRYLVMNVCWPSDFE